MAESLRELLDYARGSHESAYQRLNEFLEPGGDADAGCSMAQGLLQLYHDTAKLLIAAQAMVMVEGIEGGCSCSGPAQETGGLESELRGMTAQRDRLLAQLAEAEHEIERLQGGHGYQREFLQRIARELGTDEEDPLGDEGEIPNAIRDLKEVSVRVQEFLWLMRPLFNLPVLSLDTLAEAILDLHRRLPTPEERPRSLASAPAEEEVGVLELEVHTLCTQLRLAQAEVARLTEAEAALESQLAAAHAALVEVRREPAQNGEPLTQNGDPCQEAQAKQLAADLEQARAGAAVLEQQLVDAERDLTDLRKELTFLRRDYGLLDESHQRATKLLGAVLQEIPWDVGAVPDLDQIVAKIRELRRPTTPTIAQPDTHELIEAIADDMGAPDPGYAREGVLAPSLRAPRVRPWKASYTPGTCIQALRLLAEGRMTYERIGESLGLRGITLRGLCNQYHAEIESLRGMSPIEREARLQKLKDVMAQRWAAAGHSEPAFPPEGAGLSEPTGDAESEPENLKSGPDATQSASEGESSTSEEAQADAGFRGSGDSIEVTIGRLLQAGSPLRPEWTLGPTDFVQVVKMLEGRTAPEIVHRHLLPYIDVPTVTRICEAASPYAKVYAALSRPMDRSEFCRVLLARLIAIKGGARG